MGLFMVLAFVEYNSDSKWLLQKDIYIFKYIYIIVISDDFRIKIYECGITLTGYMSLYGINMEVHWWDLAYFIGLMALGLYTYIPG